MKRGLVNELCRVFNSGRKAMLCAMSHRQVTIDGRVILPEYDMRWPPEQLKGRMARLHDRQALLYGSMPPYILHEDESPTLEREVAIYDPGYMDRQARLAADDRTPIRK